MCLLICKGISQIIFLVQVLKLAGEKTDIMRTIISFLMIGIFSVASLSCKSDDDINYIDYDTFSVVYDIKNQDFALVNGGFQIAKTFNTPLYDSDVLLVYKQIGTTNNNSPIWQQIPITLYLTDGNELDYNFDFSRYDFVIYAGGTFDLTNSSYIKNQTFRVVVVPASFGKSANVDFSNYQSVIAYFKIDDSKPVNL